MLFLLFVILCTVNVLTFDKVKFFECFFALSSFDFYKQILFVSLRHKSRTCNENFMLLMMYALANLGGKNTHQDYNQWVTNRSRATPSR